MVSLDTVRDELILGRIARAMKLDIAQAVERLTHPLGTDFQYQPPAPREVPADCPLRLFNGG